MDGKDQLEKDLLDEFDPTNNNQQLQALIDSRKPNSEPNQDPLYSKLKADDKFVQHLEAI